MAEGGQPKQAAQPFFQLHAGKLCTDRSAVHRADTDGDPCLFPDLRKDRLNIGLPEVHRQQAAVYSHPCPSAEVMLPSPLRLALRPLRRPAGLVEATVFQCTDAGCSTTISLGFKGLGPINVGQTAKLLLQWDQVNHQFIFQRDDEPEMVIAYTVPDTFPPSNPIKTLRASPGVANCTAEPRPVSFIDASFDNVLVNESAVP